ncbi:MAG: hypothetical protein KJ900_04305 [Proteobacteria bacterium]|nr:hypothetical protein [Desulfocapsa sp.]MBU3943080.1 hypothetical protein [Pseudomonadota bacterium]MBU4042106.1 hypothetical protein [Pseudomonadota bacterium]MBU4168979.1 hypothetical protein [Pseudomonadota bacterium]
MNEMKNCEIEGTICNYSMIIHNFIVGLSLKFKRLFRLTTFIEKKEKDNNKLERSCQGTKVIINVQYGLGNRLRALASAQVLAQKTGREFVLVWIPDVHCQAEFHDLFTNDFPVINSLDKIDISRADQYNYMDTEAGSEKGKVIDHASGRDIYVKSAFVLNHKFSKDSEISMVLQQLDPVQEIKDIVGQYKVQDRIGLHIRRGGGKEASKDPWDNAANWSAKGKENLFYWRERSAPHVFMKEIDRLLAEDRSLQFFLAADSDDIYDQFQEKYPGKVSFLKRDLYDRSLEQQKYALADMLLLSQTKLILGSYWSSFSEIAQRIGGNTMKYSGKDF